MYPCKCEKEQLRNVRCMCVYMCLLARLTDLYACSCFTAINNNNNNNTVQDADTIQQVQQARLAVLQQGSRVRVKQLLRVADLDSLAEAYRAATDAQLGQQVLAQVQTMQAAAEVLQGAVQQVQQQRQQQAEAAGAAAAAGGVAAVSLQKAQEQLGSALRRMEGLSKPAGECVWGPCISWGSISWAHNLSPKTPNIKQ